MPLMIWMIGWFKRRAMPTIRQSSVVVPSIGKEGERAADGQRKGDFFGGDPLGHLVNDRVDHTALPKRAWQVRGGVMGFSVTAERLKLL